MLKPLLYHFLKFLICLSEAQWLPRKSMVTVCKCLALEAGHIPMLFFSFLPKYASFTVMVMPRRERNAAMGSCYTSGDSAKASTA
uniref:Putative secreted protein n=1 Tax=Rhipicephalus microplus TaxID=6941 RepID=A0A6M2DD52_RHIMP